MTLTDENVSPTMNIFLILANIINIIYNVPQVIKTYKTKSTKDFSEWFIFMRIVGNTIWVVYSCEIQNIQLLINTTITVLASFFIAYYKCREILTEKRQYKLLTLPLEDDLIEESLNDAKLEELLNDAKLEESSNDEKPVIQLEESV
jgi:MtN3 and saliva related transmembrane protein